MHYPESPLSLPIVHDQDQGDRPKDRSDAMSFGIGILVTIALGFLPGAWLGFTVPDRRVPWQVKSALSIALSPAVMAVEIVLFSVVGQPFSLAVYIVVIESVRAWSDRFRHATGWLARARRRRRDCLACAALGASGC